MRKPLAIDLYAGLGGWTDGLMAEGYDVVGFDIERHRYPVMSGPTGGDVKNAGGGSWFAIGSPGQKTVKGNPDARNRYATEQWQEYPAQLVLQDVLTIHGSQFRNAALIVASPPCQAYSYMAMPWKLAKAKAAAIRADESGKLLADLNELFHACFRIQREACEAAGRYIPLVVENVKGAQPWVGPAKANFGSFYLWGDVAMVGKRVVCGREFGNYTQPIRAQKFNPHNPSHASGSWFEISNSKNRGARGQKNEGGSWFNIGSPGQAETGCNPVHELAGRKGKGSWFGDYQAQKAETMDGIKCGGDWFNDKQPSISRMCSSKSPARKAASAQIAKIPLELSRYVARCYKPKTPILDRESA